MPTVYAYICVLKACIATQCRSVQRGVQRGAFSPTSGATPATPTLGATPKLLSATPKDFRKGETNNDLWSCQHVFQQGFEKEDILTGSCIVY